MAAQVTIVFKDLVTGEEGREPEHVVEGIAANISIPKLKEKALSVVKAPGDVRVLLYIGSLCLEDNKILADYNRSKRSTMTISVVREVMFNIKVKTLQNCNAGICLLVPLWALCLRQTIDISLPSQVSVGALKTKVEEELNDSANMPREKIVIAKGTRKLTDDSATLQEAGIVDGTVLTLYVSCCYFKGSNKARPAAPEKQPEAMAQNTMNGKNDAGDVQNGEGAEQKVEGEEMNGSGANQEG